jgi:hypothetical protein
VNFQRSPAPERASLKRPRGPGQAEPEDCPVTAWVRR